MWIQETFILPGGISLPVADLVICVILIIFTFLSILKSYKSRLVFNTFGQASRFIPQYNFFAPDSGVSSYRFAYRDKLSGDNHTDWEYVDGISFEVTVISIIWNPKRQTQKSLDVVAHWLLSYVNYHYEVDDGMRDLSQIEDDIPHFSHEMLIEFTRSQPHHDDAVASQFRITQALRSRDRDRRMLQSKFYELEGGSRSDS